MSRTLLGTLKEKLKDLVIKKIVEMNPIEVPESLVEEQIKHMVAQAVKNKSQDQETQTKPSNEEEIKITESQKIEHQESAIKLLQQELLLDQLATSLNVKVDENELNAEVNNMARMLGETDAQKIKKEWAKSGVLARLQSRIKRDKTLDSILKVVQVKEEFVDRKDNIDNN